MERKTKYRITVLVVLVCLLSGTLTAQMFKLQKQAEADNAVEKSRSYTYYTMVPAARGNILDRNGTMLVTNRASYNIVINSIVLFKADSPNESLLQLAKLCRELGVEYVDNLPISWEKPYEYTLENLTTTWQGYYRQFLLARELDPDMSAANLMKVLKKNYNIPNDWDEADARMVVGLRYELALRNQEGIGLNQYVLCSDVPATTLAAITELGVPGVTVQTTTVREYETKAAAHILGTVGLIYAEEWEALYKDNEDYSYDAKVGKDGLEKAFEPYLHGVDGQLETTVSTMDGEVTNERYVKLPQAGNNVMLTIDIGLQETAERALEEVILDLRKNGVGAKKEGKDAEGGALVAIDVKTGEVLVSASYPTFDLSTFYQKYNEIAKVPYGPLNNRALTLPYPPGSIYKMVTTIAAIDEAGIGRHYEIRDKGIYTFYDDYQPTCLIYKSSGMNHGVINMMQALADSCNYYFYEVGRVIGIAPMDKVAKGLGLGESTGVELPEYVGYRANPETKKELYKNTPDQSGWYDADTLMAAIGQSDNQFTPMQMASYTAALANQGTRYKATFLQKVVSSDYRQLVEQNEPEVLSSYPISDDAMAAVREGMRMAVTGDNTHGFATATTYLGDYPVPVAAKTGTAQHGSTGSDHASFVCYAPVDDPQIAIAVYVEKGAQGGNLAKAAEQVLDVYFQAADSQPIPSENVVG